MGLARAIARLFNLASRDTVGGRRAKSQESQAYVGSVYAIVRAAERASEVGDTSVRTDDPSCTSR